jgi:hypothetical protein
VFDPLESADARASQDPDTYFKVMRRNTRDLLQAFGAAAGAGSGGPEGR